MLALVLKSAPAAAYEVNDRLSINGILAGAYQHQVLGNSFPGYDDTGRGAVSFQTEINYNPTPSNEVSVKFGFVIQNLTQYIHWQS
jgi:hypothetical protein